GLGTARLVVRGTLRADLSPLELTLERTEPRGAGLVARERVVLRRQGPGWVREVTRGGRTEAAPVELPGDALVLTPPLGAGERLAR
uniref:hypothetical protein n=1 Tax=Salmonella enterica TaxID=28901 RepID=UPI0032976320